MPRAQPASVLQWWARLAQIEEQGKDNKVRQQGKQNARNLQKKISRLVPAVTQQFYGLKIITILNATEKLTSDLEYLCSLVEQPVGEFPIRDARAYAAAVTTLSNQLDFIVEELTQNDLSDDEEYVKLSQEEVLMLNAYTDSAEDALGWLEETCGISLQNN